MSTKTDLYVASGYDYLVAPATHCPRMTNMSNSWMMQIIHEYIGEHDESSNLSLIIQFSFTSPFFILQIPTNIGRMLEKVSPVEPVFAIQHRQQVQTLHVIASDPFSLNKRQNIEYLQKLNNRQRNTKKAHQNFQRSERTPTFALQQMEDHEPESDCDYDYDNDFSDDCYDYNDYSFELDDDDYDDSYWDYW
jgi:hypothetical protein